LIRVSAVGVVSSSDSAQADMSEAPAVPEEAELSPVASPGELQRAFLSALSYTFSDPDLYRRSLAHRSWCAEHGEESNERLEFLGDAVLGLAVTNHIYRTYPDLPEGDLAKLRASVVNAMSLAEVATEMGLGSQMLLGKGEDATGGREKASIVSDALEAVIGAVYLDGGWDAAEELVLRLLHDRIAEDSSGPGGGDYKTRLQELVARKYEQLPSYKVRGEGPDHAKSFVAEVFIAGISRGVGEGRSKKQAEQGAARMAWIAFESGEATV
jgi:ribonuclease III